MKFNDIKQHLDDCACTVDHLEDNVYIAKNCINGHHCMIEDLEFYNIGTLAHYLYQLNIDIPEHIQEFVHVYTQWREHIKDVGFVPIDKNTR